LLHQKDVSHVAVAFDHVIESFRNELFSGYKTGEGVEPDLMAQFDLAERATHALGIVVWPMVEFEADDALATASARWKDAPGVEQIVICSPDKDLTQCVEGTRVVCLDRRREIVRDEEGVVAKFGVGPKSIPDWLALVGDRADGIPGIHGWGAKTSASLLSRYLHIEAIPDDDSSWGVKIRGAGRLVANLRENRNELLLYRQLATLRMDVPLSEGLEDLEWRGARRRELDSICREIDDPRFIDRIFRWRV
jgi:5'-3' exonuclease